MMNKNVTVDVCHTRGVLPGPGVITDPVSGQRYYAPWRIMAVLKRKGALEHEATDVAETLLRESGSADLEVITYFAGGMLAAPALWALTTLIFCL